MSAVALESQQPTTLDTLSTFGFSLREADTLNKLTPEERVDVLTQQARSLAVEVLADDPVSTPFSYWYDDEAVYTNPSRRDVYKVRNGVNEFFDPRERGNLPWYGFQRAIRLAQNSDRVVLFYSPTGKTYFDHDYLNPTEQIEDTEENPYKQIETYRDGQLYLFYNTGSKIDGLALKTSSNDVVAQFMPEVYAHTKAATTEESYVARFMLNSVTTPYTIDDFLSRAWFDGVMYKDKNGREHTISEVLGSAREVLAGKQRDFGGLNQDVLESLKTEVTASTILHAYLSVVQNYARAHGITETIQLSGSCGGKTVNLGDVEALLGMNNTSIRDFINTGSSIMRAMRQGGLAEAGALESSMGSVEFTGERVVTCPCGRKVTVTKENLDGGELKCSCGNKLDNKCDVEAVYKGGSPVLV